MTSGRLWPKYKTVGVHTLLEDAINVLQERPLCKGTVRHRETGAVDVVGALALASGAKFDDLINDYLSIPMPKGRMAAYYAAISLIESAVDEGDVSMWNDAPNRTVEDIEWMLSSLANEISLSGA